MSGHKGVRRMQMARALLDAAEQVNHLSTPATALSYSVDPPRPDQPDQLAVNIVEMLRQAASLLLKTAVDSAAGDSLDDDGDEL